MSRYLFEAFAKKTILSEICLLCQIYCPKTTQMFEILCQDTQNIIRTCLDIFLKHLRRKNFVRNLSFCMIFCPKTTQMSEILYQDTQNIIRTCLDIFLKHLRKKQFCPKFVFLSDFLSEDNTNVRNFVLGHSKHHQDMSSYLFEAFAKRKILSEICLFCLISCPKTTQMSEILSQDIQNNIRTFPDNVLNHLQKKNFLPLVCFEPAIFCVVIPTLNHSTTRSHVKVGAKRLDLKLESAVV